MKIIYDGFDAKLVRGRRTSLDLETPILIKRNLKYEINLSFAEEALFTISGALKSEVEIKPGITIKFEKRGAKNTPDRGLIYALHFIEV